jgi:hypothetical protein
MKAPLLILILLAAVALLPHWSLAATRQYGAPQSPTFTHKHHAVENRERSFELQPDITGVIPRAIRGGQPLQMLNAFAPAKYGTAEENVSLDPDVPRKGNWINLFSVSF